MDGSSLIQGEAEEINDMGDSINSIPIYVSYLPMAFILLFMEIFTCIDWRMHRCLRHSTGLILIYHIAHGQIIAEIQYVDSVQ